MQPYDVNVLECSINLDPIDVPFLVHSQLGSLIFSSANQGDLNNQ